MRLTRVSESVISALQGVERLVRSAVSMNQREQIEGDLIQITARLHDLALCGISVANLRNVQLLTAELDAMIIKADAFCPKIVKFPISGAEPLRERARLESVAGEVTRLGIETSGTRHNKTGDRHDSSALPDSLYPHAN